MKRVLWVLAFVVGGYFIVRALVEPFVVDFSDPASYADDWGGPSIFGVLLVHMGPGIIAAALLIWALRRNDRRQNNPGEDESRRPL